ncbi:GNAT family N-acetyltransferase [Paenibacillus puerhi]|uniref:GNAT family N-acetyltransferase n=1 Tax=Paenibacillus puerhi TaxID=2692622 RepID=UPI00135967AF|nr:GNAT family N-acetyltransferase [Paenibacillus puerhi]
MTDNPHSPARTGLPGEGPASHRQPDQPANTPLPLFRITPLLPDHCREICEWRYEPPYDLYAWQPWELMVAQQAEFADPELRDAQYRAVLGQLDELCGFAQLFPMTGVTRLGLGMRPEACGRGRGAAFVRAIAAEARRLNPGHEIDLEVLTWNERAIRAYLRAGFSITDTYERMTPAGQAEFHCMVWSESE